jgi:hypothetical protein
LRIFPITGIEGCPTQCEVRGSRAHANVWSLKEGKRHASAVAMMDQSIERESAFDPVSKGQRCLRRFKPFGRSLHDVVITAIDGRNIP